jgi:hypothetical protein
MKKLIISTFALMAFSLSCTNLDENVYDKIPEDLFPENDQQSALAVVPAYQELADLIDDAGWWFWAQEVTSDEIAFPVRLTDWEDGGKWRVLHQHAWDNNTDAINSMWSHMYDGIFEANKAIDGFGDVGDDPAAQSTIAKLKVLRAFYYYLLIDNYGDVPYITSFFDVPDQPMKEDRLVIWQNIVDEVEAGLQFLPVSANNFAVSKGMAYMLLAKLYINAEAYGASAMWAKAEQYCDSVIMSGQYFLEAHPLDPFKADNESSGENIFTIPFDEINLKGFRFHMRTLHYQHDQTFEMVAGPWNGFAAVYDHYNTFEDGDLRKEMFLVGPQLTATGNPIFDETAEAPLDINPVIPALVMDGSYSFTEIRMSGARVAKFEIEKGADENLNNDFPFFRYADALLMKAETVIRQGGNGDMYVNDVRDRANMGPLSGVTLDMLLEERGREMFCEGHRRQDLIRFGQFNDAWWEKPASSQDRNIFPIPQWAIDANPNLGL